ncbi:MAG TPA: MBL fold metallo-hydrolase [Acidimicrobiales bacterium]|nr:MBL fold metallo-hydrolase [Acidimicrobiales bacterium]
MELTYHGLSSVRLRGRETTVHVDPPNAALPGLGRSGRDLVVRTQGPTDPAKLRQQEGHLQEVSGPGEFEVRGVSIYGLPAGDTTVMRIEVDDIRVLATGRLDRQLGEEDIDALGHVDVLVVPVGGGDALNATDASKLVHAIEPAIVVPVRFRSGGAAEFEPVDRFAKEMGLAEGAWQMQPRLNLTGAPTPGETVAVVILEPRS